MFGWEFPPHNSGGLGTACEGLVRGLLSKGVSVTFVLPKQLGHQEASTDSFKMLFADCAKDPDLAKLNEKLSVIEVDSPLSPYITSKAYEELIEQERIRLKLQDENSYYSNSLFGEVLRYAVLARKIALTEEFDVIHAHDWLSFPAGMAAKQASGKPLIAHVHATEFDRSGGNNVYGRVYDIERKGIEEADAVIAVSHFTKKKLVDHYSAEPEKVHVVHNAVEYQELMQQGTIDEKMAGLKATGNKIVLFVGRITLQKGPDYFLQAARKVIDRYKKVVFVVVGSGDMEIKMIETAAELDIADKVVFAGFLRGKDLARAYKMADLYILPSVSEPFGITPLESMSHETPVLVSKQSGVSEVITHALKVDFWDTDEMANKIVAVLQYPELYHTLRENGFEEIKRFSWKTAAGKCAELYEKMFKKSKKK
jgi:glycosyltransferase involved in cell wall biosynthesis